ncbi:hypothetical protein SAMN05421640_3166 [Ekhidna lutea]|uniref:Lipocalin-like domain-containing protein n=1 Tax=Ekhidna lutea TaxID=447679 RepID=A0A239LEG0_EKHLU|nr:hypothetical protein [Ekhidna lutea]SNT28322.1 hypothetical protein SAMN05421640_3166 [Ekhidna lutea]
MKYTAHLFILLSLLVNCKPKSPALQQTGMEEQLRDKLTGAWRMTDYMTISNEGDTSTDERVQFKMYVDGSVMWGFESPAEYTEWYGYGTYNIEGDTLYETMLSGSWAFRQAIANNGNFFRIAIDVTDSTYTQIIKGPEETTYESYERIRN